MIFHSLDFAAFFLMVVSIYWRLPHRGQNLLLLGGQLRVLRLGASVVRAHHAGLDHGRLLGRPAHGRRPGAQAPLLAASLAVNLGMLGVFKYFNFFIENVRDVLGAIGLTVAPPLLELVLPAGISFYTFQALSYTVDVYRARCARAATRSTSPSSSPSSRTWWPGRSCAPRTCSCRWSSRARGTPRWPARGVVLVMWGLFKKLVIADNVGVIANRVFAQQDPAFEVLWAGVFAFGMQIYADFSAYSDIARGVARWFGFELMVNFNHPYIAHSPTDFWRRWHISLSTWFRDYVYIPLGGNRGGAVVAACTLITTFLVSGFWHGASWNYVLWGFYHGAARVADAHGGAGAALARALARPARARAGGAHVAGHDGRLAVLPRDQRRLPRPLRAALAGHDDARRGGGWSALLRAGGDLVAAALPSRSLGPGTRASGVPGGVD